MRVSRRIADGFIAEAQSGDEASLDVLLQNLVSGGLDPKEYEVLVMPDDECFAAIKAQQPEQPKKLSVEALAEVLIGKGVLSKSDVDAAAVIELVR